MGRSHWWWFCTRSMESDYRFGFSRKGRLRNCKICQRACRDLCWHYFGWVFQRFGNQHISHDSCIRLSNTSKEAAYQDLYPHPRISLTHQDFFHRSCDQTSGRSKSFLFLTWGGSRRFLGDTVAWFCLCILGLCWHRSFEQVRNVGICLECSVTLWRIGMNLVFNICSRCLYCQVWLCFSKNLGTINRCHFLRSSIHCNYLLMHICWSSLGMIRWN